jgi:hypothetical protein
MESKKKKMKGGITGKGFDVNPQNIGKSTGRPPSIRKQLKEMLGMEGKLPIPKKYLVEEKDEEFIFKIPNEQSLALRLLSMAMSGQRHIALKALKMIMEQIDGKPTQAINVNSEEFLTAVRVKLIDNETDDK